MSENTDAGKTFDQASAAVNDAVGSVGEQLAALRKQVEDLLADRQKYMSQAMDAAEGYAARATDATRVQYEAVTDRVRERPGQSLLIAAGVGYILARILGR